MAIIPTLLDHCKDWLRGTPFAGHPPANLELRDPFELLDAGHLQLQATGAGLYAVRIDLRLLTPDSCGIQIPVGTRFLAENQRWQDMIVIQPFRTDLRDRKPHHGEVRAACLNSTRATPDARCKFHMERPCPDDSVGRLIRALGEQKVDPAHWQQHIWRVTTAAPKPAPTEQRRLSA